MRCDRTVKVRHVLDEEGFHYSQFVTIIVVTTSTFLTSSSNYFQYKRIRSKEYRYLSSTTGQKVKRNSQLHFSQVRQSSY